MDDSEKRTGTPEPFSLSFGTKSGSQRLAEEFDRTRMAMCVTDPHQPDNPIVYVNSAFEKLTGYDGADIIGGNCRFLQGNATDPAAVADLRAAIGSESVCIVELVNYRKDGAAFWNALHIGPIYDEHGKLRYFFGSQWDVTNVRAARHASVAHQPAARTANAELNHRVRSLFKVLGSIVSLSATGREEQARGRRRIAALGRAHEGAENPMTDGSVAHLADLAREILDPFAKMTDIGIEGDAALLQISAITPLGLILHELATNSVRYGSLGGHGAGLSLSWTRSSGLNGERLQIVWCDLSSGEHAGSPGGGTRIIEAMTASFGGSYRVEANGGRYEAMIDLPTEAVLLRSGASRRPAPDLTARASV